MSKAVFIDRDGVINPLVFYSDTKEWESPRTLKEFHIYEYVPGALKTLMDKGYFLFVVSNQPSYAKGKMTWENVKAIEHKLADTSQLHGNLIDEFYYCYHHPQAVIPEYAIKCECRKPGTLFLRMAIAKYNLETSNCYFIGDQDNDILCGLTMGVRTIRILNQHPASKSCNVESDFYADNLLEATVIIGES